MIKKLNYKQVTIPPVSSTNLEQDHFSFFLSSLTRHKQPSTCRNLLNASKLWNQLTLQENTTNTSTNLPISRGHRLDIISSPDSRRFGLEEKNFLNIPGIKFLTPSNLWFMSTFTNGISSCLVSWLGLGTLWISLLLR